MRSVLAIALGVLLTLAVGLLVVFGIIWPVFEAFLDPELIRSAGWILVLLAFAVAFAFYFGGMLASYRAPNHRMLHGTLVAPATFVISPVVNLASGNGAFPNVNSSGTAALILVFFVVSALAAHVGSRRGVALHIHNRRYAQKRGLRERRSR